MWLNQIAMGIALGKPFWITIALEISFGILLDDELLEVSLLMNESLCFVKGFA